MPIYVYETTPNDDQEPERFELEHPMASPPFTAHPVTGVAIRRIICAPSVGGKWSDRALSTTLQDGRAAAKGFTKYVNQGNGVYEKTYGKGPRLLKRD